MGLGKLKDHSSQKNVKLDAEMVSKKLCDG